MAYNNESSELKRLMMALMLIFLYFTKYKNLK